MRKSMLTLQQRIEIRIISAANLYLQDPLATTRSVADAMGYSKTTVHRDFRERLPKIDRELSDKVAKRLDENFEAKASRGGKKTALNRHL